MNSMENKIQSGQPLESRIAVVARGSGRTGRAIAEKLAEAGAKVVIADINLINAEVVVQAIANKYRSEAIAVAIKSQGIESVLSAFSSFDHGWSEFKIWINAGCMFQPEQPASSSETHREQIEKNMKQVFQGCRQVAEYMSASNSGGIIVNIIPVNECRVLNGTSTLSKTDEYITVVTKSLADELATKGIRVFTVSPVTGWNNPEEGEFENGGPDNDCPEDVANSVLFCITILSKTMTGSTLRLNGKKVSINSIH